MRKTLLILITSSCVLFSCNSSNNSAVKESNTPSDTAMNTSPVSAEAPAQMPVTNNNGSISAPATVPQATAPTAVGMNPAHGEPGHRCDIAVGAPLNSPPTQKAAAPVPGNIQTTPAVAPATINTSPQTANPAGSAPVPVVTAPGMNPPHGEPGHDCKVAVGAPLPK